MSRSRRFNYLPTVSLVSIIFVIVLVSSVAAQTYVEPGVPYNPSMDPYGQSTANEKPRDLYRQGYERRSGGEGQYRNSDSYSNNQQRNWGNGREPGYQREKSPVGDYYGFPSERQKAGEIYNRRGRDEYDSPSTSRQDWYNQGRQGESQQYQPIDRDARPSDLNAWQNPDAPGNRRPEEYTQGGYPPPKAGNMDHTYSSDEIVDAGHRFFGSVTKGLAKVIQSAFSKSGRPVAYILGEEGSGAVVAGLRYGEGVLHTKFSGKRRVYWQGPSIGYDFGANGSKTLTLVYNLQHIEQIYGRYSGVTGSAYVVGGVGITYQQKDQVRLAPIRSGVGLRLGANVGYLKYTRRPTWNPF